MHIRFKPLTLVVFRDQDFTSAGIWIKKTGIPKSSEHLKMPKVSITKKKKRRRRRKLVL